MTKLEFETLSFSLQKDKVQVGLLKSWSLNISLGDLEKIGPVVVGDHWLEFDGLDQEKAAWKFSNLLEKYMPSLTTKITGNSATYIHRNLGVPLIGNVAFGIVYRGSSIIEIKPNNGCNLDCVYCSISEGLSSKKHDYVIEKDYLVEELEKVLEFVGEPVEIHIGVQGEPFLYGDMENLIEDLQGMIGVHTISIDTNGTLLSRGVIDRLGKCDKLQINLSLDAIDPDIAARVAGTKRYDIEKVKEMIAYACTKLKVIVAPVFTPGFNEEEMEKIVQWIKTLAVQPILGIQNFLPYKTGRNPAPSMGWEEFYAMLDRLEKKYSIKLRLSKEDFNVRETVKMEKPFFAGKVVNCRIKMPGRFPNTVIAVCQERNILVSNCKFVKDKMVRVKIEKDKHNIFAGKLM